MINEVKNAVIEKIKEKILWVLFVVSLVSIYAGILTAKFFNEPTKVIIGEECSTEQVIEEKSGEDKGAPYLVIDLAGSVVKPGIYKLAKDAIVADVLKLGGGILETGAEVWVARYLDLSRSLNESQKIYIPFEWEISYYFPTLPNVVVEPLSPMELVYKTDRESEALYESETYESSSSTTTDSSSKINVNLDDQLRLMSLTGIGEVYAQKIIDNRPFKDFTEFENKSGLSKSVSAKIKDAIIF